MWTKLLIIVALSSMTLLLAVPVAETADGRGRVHSRQVVVRPHYWGGWGDPFWGGYYPPNYYVPDYRGKVKLRGFSDLDRVYVNGAYAGSVDDMDSFRLDPGRYTIEIRNGERSLVRKNVYVVTGKTVEITRGSNVDR